MQDKNGNIIIHNPQVGMGDSPYVGYGRMQNVEINQVPGILKMKYRSVLKYSVVGLPMAIVRDSLGNEYVGTDRGYFYKNGLLQRSDAVKIYDLKVWQDYLLITRDTVIDVYGPLSSGGASYFQNWKTGLTSGYFHKLMPLLPTGGAIMYVGNGNSVGTLTSFVAGDPGVPSAPTATWNATAVPLAFGEYCQTLGVLGRFLLIGTQGGGNFQNVNRLNIANIYPYDLGSLTLGIPLQLNENGINQIFVSNNLAYIHAGIYGNVYRTNGSSIEFYKKIPYNKVFGTAIFPYPNAINYINNELLIGTSTLNDTFPGSLSTQAVYSIRDTNKALSYRTISTTNIGSDQTLQIGVILPTGQDNMLIGWQDGTSYGVDEIDSTLFENYSVFFEAPVEIVAEPENNATFDDIIVYTANPLVSGQSIRLRYRDGLLSTYTDIGIITSSSAKTGSTGYFIKSKINNSNTVQVECALKQENTVLFGNNINILGIKILRHTNG